MGGCLFDALQTKHEVQGTSWEKNKKFPDLDIRDKTKVKRLINEIHPDQTILTAALTYVDKCEEEPKLAAEINVQGVENVAQACRQVGATMTFFSTDYIYLGIFPYIQARIII